MAQTPARIQVRAMGCDDQREGRRLMRVDYDRFAALAPVDKGAAQTLRMRGETYEPPVANDHSRWLAPPPLKPTPPNAEDLTGIRYGRLLVMGLHAELKDPGRWVVRCDCGAYEARRARTLRSGERTGTMCSHCDATAEVISGNCPSPREREELRKAKGRDPTKRGRGENCTGGLHDQTT